MDSFWKRLRHNLTVYFLPLVGYVVVKSLVLTMRLEEKGSNAIASYDREGKPFICVFWHGHLLMMLASPYRKNARVMVSRHRDGELISRMVGLFGLESVRGSTTQGGVQALKGSIRAINQGYKVVITPDGPRGPRFKVQPGVIELARLTGAPVIPVAFSCTKKKVFSSWDRFILPYPFSRGVFFYGEPFRIPLEITKEALESKRQALETLMRQMTRKVESYCETGIWRDE